MGISVSLLLAAGGAILLWAFDGNANSSFDINTIGLILLIVGIVGVVISFAFWSSWGGFGGTDRRVERETVIRD